MSFVKVRVKKIFCLYHPNGVTDETSPKGYRLTGGGKWVVEWSVRYPNHIFDRSEHYSKAFRSYGEAKQFEKDLKLRANDKFYIAETGDICLNGTESF